MPIQSFLVYTKDGQMQDTCAALRAIPAAEVTPADDRNIVILVTETEGKRATQWLEATLEGIPGIDGYALVAGFDDISGEALAGEEKLT